MATIDDCMLGRIPGSVKIRIVGQINGWFFRPYFREPSGVWYGLSNGEIARTVMTDSADWEICEQDEKHGND
jgi:hypothetical protein